MRWIRRLLIALSVVIAIAAVAIVLLFTIDLSLFKGTVEDYVSAKTGRQLTIAGTFQPELGSTIDLVAEDVTLTNAEWGTAENILEFSRVVISVDTWSVISGPIRVLNLEVYGLDIHVEKNADTLRHSWLFKDKPRKPPGTPRKRFELPLWLEKAVIKDVRVTYGQGWLDSPRTVSVTDAEFFADQSDLLRMTIEGAIDDKPLNAKGTVGPLRALLDGYAPRWELEVSIDQFVAATEGTFGDLFRAQEPNIHATMQGPAAERTLARLGMPPLATGPVDIEANLETIADGIRLVVDGAIGDLEADVVARTESFKTVRDLDLSLDVRGPNLRAIGALFGAGFLPARAFAIRGDATGRPNNLVLDSVVLTAGDAQLEVDGKLAAASVDADAELRISASGPEILEFLPPVLRERVPSGAFEVSGSATGDPGLIQLDNLSARLADFELKAAGTVPVGSGMAGLDLALTARGPDFEQVVEPWFEADVLAEPYSAQARIRNDGEGYVIDDLQFEIANAYLRIDGTTGLLPSFKGLDAQVSLGGEDLQATLESLFDVGLPPVSFGIDGKFEGADGALLLTGVEYRLGDAHGTVDGTTGRWPSLEGLRLNTSLSGPDASQFAAVLGDYEEGGFVPAQPFQTRGLFSKTDGVWFASPWTLEIADSRLEMRGALGDFAGGQGIDLQITASGPDLRRFVPAEGIDWELPYEFNGGLKIESDKIQLREVDVRIARTTASFDGTVPTSADAGDAEFQLTAAGPNLATLGYVFGVPDLPDEAYRVQGSLARSGQAYSVADLEAVVGEDDISGDFEVELGEKLRLSGQLTSENLDLTTWFGDDEKPDAGGVEERNRVIPDTALPLGMLDAADLDITLRLHRLKTRNLDVGDVELKVLMADDELHVETGQVSLKNGGDMSATLDVVRMEDARASVSFDLVGNQFQLRPNVDADGNPITRPPEDLELSIVADGGTFRELAAGANGRVSLRQGEGDFDNDLSGFLMRDFLSQIFGAINPFAADEKYTHLECGFVEIDIVDGIARSRAIGFQTDKISVASVGQIDFADESLDLSFRVKQREGLGISVAGIVNPYVKVGGTLVDPSLDFDAKRGLLSGTVAFLTGGLSILAQGVWDRHLAKEDYCEAIEEALGSGEIPRWTGESDED